MEKTKDKHGIATGTFIHVWPERHLFKPPFSQS